MAWASSTAAPALAKISLHRAHPFGGAGVVLFGVQEEGRKVFVSTLPAHQLVVVHFWKNVVVAEPLGVFIELLAPADENGLQGGIAIEHGAFGFNTSAQRSAYQMEARW